MLSEKLRQYAADCWVERKKTLGTLGQSLQQKLDCMTGDSRTLMELTLGTLPASDLAEVPVETLEEYVSHGLYLRSNSPFCREIPEDIFLHYVFYPRINNEEITPCRPFFYKMVAPIVENLPLEEAILAVNRWCASEMTYESTDPRTISPMGAYGCGLGRCGEESTFCVSVMRAVGIPTRQIYTPWWSHCDDNHAWVEVYVNGDWHFFGASEPEPVLDRGWFPSAASRAMAICSRVFCDYRAEGLESETILGQQDCCILYNETHRYAKTAQVKIQVAGGPAKVRVYVINMSSFARLTEAETDETGAVTLELGLGSCLLEAKQGDLFGWERITITGPVEISLTADRKGPALGEADWDVLAPAPGKGNGPLTKEQAERRKRELLEAGQDREKKLRRVRAEGMGDPEVDDLLHQAGQNGNAIRTFLETHGVAAKEIMKKLTRKDWRDAKTATLEVFLDYPQCTPRIGWEPLRPWPEAVKQIPAHLIQQPEQLERWIEAHYADNGHRWYPSVWMSPAGTMALGAGRLRDRQVLCTAALQLGGIPAKLDQTLGKVCYFMDGEWHVLGTLEPGCKLHVNNEQNLKYGQSWALARWNDGWETVWGQIDSLLPGIYCAITSNRLPNGNQLIRLHTFCLEEEIEISPVRRQAEESQMLASYPVNLPVAADAVELQLYLEVGAEPTEHVLNELLEAEQVPWEKVRLVIPEKKALENPTLQKVLQASSNRIRVAETDFADASVEMLARALYLEPGAWPLMVLTDGKIAGYSHCGYAVGTVGLALELMKQMETRL